MITASDFDLTTLPLTTHGPETPARAATQTAGPWFWFHYQFGHRDYKQQIVVTSFFFFFLRRFALVCCAYRFLYCLWQVPRESGGFQGKKTSPPFFLSFMSNADFPFLTHPTAPHPTAPPSPPLPLHYFHSAPFSRQLWSAQKLIFRVLTTMFFLPTAEFHLQSTGGQYLG